MDTPDGLVVEAPKRAIGRERTSWTPMRRVLELGGRMDRYGCECGRSELLGDREMREDIRRGETDWVIAGSNISNRRRSGMDEHVRPKGIG
ncbi:MAG: hypothetical protein ACRDWT_05545 [Jatrophihabitantaceae bacterium]